MYRDRVQLEITSCMVKLNGGTPLHEYESRVRDMQLFNYQLPMIVKKPSVEQSYYVAGRILHYLEGRAVQLEKFSSE